MVRRGVGISPGVCVKIDACHLGAKKGRWQMPPAFLKFDTNYKFLPIHQNVYRAPICIWQREASGSME